MIVNPTQPTFFVEHHRHGIAVQASNNGYPNIADCVSTTKRMPYLMCSCVLREREPLNFGSVDHNLSVVWPYTFAAIVVGFSTVKEAIITINHLTTSLRIYPHLACRRRGVNRPHIKRWTVLIEGNELFGSITRYAISVWVREDWHLKTIGGVVLRREDNLRSIDGRKVIHSGETCIPEPFIWFHSGQGHLCTEKGTDRRQYGCQDRQEYDALRCHGRSSQMGFT